MAQVKMNPLTKEEVTEYFRVVEERGNLMYKTLVNVLFITGMRISEAHTMLPHSISFESLEIHIENTKRDKMRDVFLDKPTAKMLKDYIQDNKVAIDLREKEFDRLVAQKKRELDKIIQGKNKAGQVRKLLRAYMRTLTSPLWGISYRQMHRVISNFGRKAGISKSVHPHSWRYNFAQLLHDNDTDIIEIQGLLGHSSISTTRGYIAYNKALARTKFDEAMSIKR